MKRKAISRKDKRNGKSKMQEGTHQIQIMLAVMHNAITPSTRENQ
jgi:hypothetical protein